MLSQAIADADVGPINVERQNLPCLEALVLRQTFAKERADRLILALTEARAEHLALRGRSLPSVDVHLFQGYRQSPTSRMQATARRLLFVFHKVLCSPSPDPIRSIYLPYPRA